MMHIFFISLIVTLAKAEYSPLYQALLDGNSSKVSELSLAELKSDTSIQKKRTLLKLFGIYKDQLYKVDDFKGQVLPFNNGQCDGVCAEHKGFKFFLNSKTQTMTIQHLGHEVLKYQTQVRTSSKNSTVQFGRAVHLIEDRKYKDHFYILIREIESLKDAPLHQTINVFRVDSKKSCRLSEADVTEDDGPYHQTVEFIRVLGSKKDCASPPVKI